MSAVTAKELDHRKIGHKQFEETFGKAKIKEILTLPIAKQTPSN